MKQKIVTVFTTSDGNLDTIKSWPISREQEAKDEFIGNVTEDNPDMDVEKATKIMEEDGKYEFPGNDYKVFITYHNVENS